MIVAFPQYSVIPAVNIRLCSARSCCIPGVGSCDRWTFTPGHTGTTLIFYARVTDIVIGVIIVLVFDMIYPW